MSAVAAGLLGSGMETHWEVVGTSPLLKRVERIIWDLWQHACEELSGEDEGGGALLVL